MGYPRMGRKAYRRENRNLSALIIELANAVFGFFYEGDEERVGTLALSLPKADTTPSTSAIVMGARNVTPTRLLAEFLAQKYAKIAFASVFTHRENDLETTQQFLKLARETEVVER